MKQLILSAAILGVTFPLLSADDSVTTDHKPNAYTLACLQAPTQDCAFKAALQTVIDEEFGVERAKVLIGVASSMIAIGQNEQAIQTLMVALDEARSVNLSPVTQEKITGIAPLLAKAGDLAGALALTEELRRDVIRDRVLIEIARDLVDVGDLGGAKAALQQVSNQSAAFWKYTELLTEAPHGSVSDLEFEHLLTEAHSYTDPAQKYRGLIRIAIIADGMGRDVDRDALLAEADEVFPAVVSFTMRAEAMGERARLMYNAGMDDGFVKQSYDLAVLHGSRVRNHDVQANLARNLGPIEAASGNIVKALKRMDYIVDLDDKAKYLSSLPYDKNEPVLASETRTFLEDIKEIPGAYDRDLIRLDLLNGAIRMANQPLASQIISELEDDDNQALGLVLMAPILS